MFEDGEYVNHHPSGQPEDRRALLSDLYENQDLPPLPNEIQPMGRSRTDGVEEQPMVWRWFSFILSKVVVCMCIVSILFILFRFNADEALLWCRVYSIFCAFLMFISGIVMFKNSMPCLIEKRAEAQIIAFSQAHVHIAITVRFFVILMTMISLSGYFGQYAQYKIFWDYDFALKYTHQNLEMTIDIVYQTFLILFELINAYYILVVALDIGVKNSEYELFFATLMANALQKWIFETLEVLIENCEEMISQNGTCHDFIHYHTNRQNLTVEESMYYGAMANNNPFVFTCTMELYIGCIAVYYYLEVKTEPNSPSLVEIFKKSMACIQNWLCRRFVEQPVVDQHVGGQHGVNQHGVNQPAVNQPAVNQPAVDQPVADQHVGGQHGVLRKNNLLRKHSVVIVLTFICIVAIVTIQLLLMYLFPITIVSIDDIDLRLKLSVGRIALNGLLLFFGLYIKWALYEENGHEETINHADLIILKISFYSTGFKSAILFVIQVISYYILYTRLDPNENLFMILMTIANVFEFLAFFNLISFTKKFLWLGKITTHPNHVTDFEEFKNNTFLKNYSAYIAAPFFVFVGLVKFASYYLLNRLRVVPYNTDYAKWDDILTVFHSLYPTTMLFSMTLAICFGHVIEEFFNAGLYTFRTEQHHHQQDGHPQNHPQQDGHHQNHPQHHPDPGA